MKTDLKKLLLILKLTLFVAVLLLGLSIAFTIPVPDVSCPGEMGYVHNGECVYE